MIRNRISLVMMVFAFFGSRGSADERQSHESLEIVRTSKLEYLLYTPPEYNSDKTPSKHWPLMLFLHGAGERGSNLELVKTHGPPKLVENGRDFPFLLVSPQCPANRWWSSQELLELIDHVVATERVDESRIYVTGLSMGGYGTWDLVARAPARFAAIAPVCGGGIPYRARLHAHVPTWAFHGTDDFVVPFAASEQMISAIKRHGGDPKLTVYEGVGHDSWTDAYNTDELFTWFLEQKRPSKPESAKAK